MKSRLFSVKSDVQHRCNPQMILCAAALLLLMPLTASQADGPAATETISAPMAVDWKYTGEPMPGGLAGSVVDGNVVVFPAGKRIYGLSLHSGAKLWEYPDGADLPQDVLATPIVSEGNVYVPTGAGLYTLDVKTGALKFPPFKLLNGGVITAPVAIGNSVYFGGSDGKLYGINQADGQPLPGVWGKGINTNVGLMGNMAQSHGVLYFVTNNNELHAFTAADATQQWSVRLPGGGSNVTPVIEHNQIYVADGQVICSYSTDGVETWIMRTRNTLTAPPGVAPDGSVYITTSLPAIFALNIAHQLVWKEPAILDYPVTAAPVVAGNILIAGSTAGGVYAIDRSTGKLMWDYSIAPTSIDPRHVPVYNSINVPPVVAGTKLLVTTNDGSLTTFSNSVQDSLPPSITPIMPRPGQYTSGDEPFVITAKISDQGCGLNPKMIHLSLDGNAVAMRPNSLAVAKKLGFLFHKDTGMLTYTLVQTSTGTANELTDGHHTITITATDWKGNSTTYSWIFTVGDAYPAEDTVQNSGNQRRGGYPGMGGGKGGGGLVGG